MRGGSINGGVGIAEFLNVSEMSSAMTRLYVCKVSLMCCVSTYFDNWFLIAC